MKMNGKEDLYGGAAPAQQATLYTLHQVREVPPAAPDPKPSAPLT